MLAIAATWGGWWIYSQRPLREMYVNDVPPMQSKCLVEGAVERLVLWGHWGLSSSICEFDFQNGRFTVVSQTSEQKHCLVAPRFSWVAWGLNDGTVHVAQLPGGQSRLTIPAR